MTNEQAKAILTLIPIQGLDKMYMDNFIKRLYIVYTLLLLIICIYPFHRPLSEIKNILIFFTFRDWLTKQITKIGICCFAFYAFIKVYITLASKDDPFHYTQHLLALFESLLASIVASFIFYLIFSGFQDRLQFKNDFILLLSEYQEMKYEIMRLMILAQHNYVIPRGFVAIVKSCSQSPQKAFEYLSKEIFEKILNNLDELPTLQILRYMQSFLKTLEAINNRFVQKGIFDLNSIYRNIKDHEIKLETMLLGKQGKDLWVALDWSENLELKSTNVLYLLFCQKGQQGADPIFQIFEQVQQKYSPS